MKLANLFREMLVALDRGKNQMAQFLYKENCGCCIVRRERPVTVSKPTLLADEISLRVVDAIFRELSRPTRLAPKSPPKWTCDNSHSGTGESL